MEEEALGNNPNSWGTREDRQQCAETLHRYIEAGLTGLIVRIASADQKKQMRIIIDELKPRLFM